MSSRIGFMQGRLSPIVDGKIQAFPWDHWREEFPVAEQCGFSIMEWTMDQDRLDHNPLMTEDGRHEIRRLADRHGIRIPTLTGDCFMQAPFHKTAGAEREALIDCFSRVVAACGDLGVGCIVLPLVDDSALEDRAQEEDLAEGLARLLPGLERHKVRIIFESDFPAAHLADFVAALPAEHFGINYDIGNSASLGFDPGEEIAAYGERIENVHVKDRILGGTTVPLGEGDADFPTVFEALKRQGYQGLFVLQTARAADNDHAGTLRRYRDLVAGWLADAEPG